MNTEQLFEQAKQLPTDDKWRLVKELLSMLEHTHTAKESDDSDWHEFLRETYGSLRDTPIKRWDQGEYEEREPIE